MPRDAEKGTGIKGVGEEEGRGAKKSVVDWCGYRGARQEFSRMSRLCGRPRVFSRAPTGNQET